MNTPSRGTLRIPRLRAGISNLEAALAYAKNGFYVGPTRPSDRKNPGSLLGPRWQEKSSRNADTIRAWFTPTHDDDDRTDRGVFIHCGRSGAVVVDVDEPDRVPRAVRSLLRGVPHWTTSESGARRHYLFRMPKGRNLSNSTGTLRGMGFDVRGANGVIVVYPTVHPEALPKGHPARKPAKDPSDPGRYGIGRAGEAAKLPAELAKGMTEADTQVAKVSYADAAEFLEKCRGNERVSALNGPINRFTLAAYVDRDARHEAMLRSLTWAMKEAYAGAYPARDAAEELFAEWRQVFEDIDGRRNSPSKTEFEGMLRYAISKAVSHDVAATRTRLGLAVTA